MSVTVKERDRERDWDSRSFHDDRPRGSVTIRRYHVPDRSDNDDRHETASRYSRRENTLASPRPSEFRESSNVREYRFERDVETERPRDRDLYEYRSERARSPPRDDYREVRIEREISRDPPRRDRDRDRDRDSYELDHYTKTTDYYAREPRESPTPIIIRNDAPAPIIIREQAPQPLIIREEHPRSPRSEIHREREERRTEIERKSEVNEEQTLVKRDPSPPPQDDEYYYQRTTRELQRRDNRERDDYDDYRSQREVRPRDSASQYGRRDESEDYYYRREEYDTGERARSKSRHRLHVAEGALAGLAAGGLINSRRKKEGEKSGGLKNLAGGAIVGAAATEIVSRARSRFRGDRSRSGSRDRSHERHGPHDREGRHRYRDHSRDRSRSRSKSQEGFWNNHSNLGKLGAVAAIGALAGYAASRRGKNKDKEVDDDRRSRSRVRRSSQDRDVSVDSDSALNKHHRNSTIAKAGLASAAVAGVVDHVRSRSRGGRSRSRFRTGAPIAAAGIGGAALAGLYEHQKAKKEARALNEERARSASRGRTADDRHSYRSRDASQHDRDLIEYGDKPLPPAGQYERPHSRGSYYDEYASRRRSRSGSGSASPRRHRYSSRSRSRDRAADAAAGAGIAGVAAHEASQHRDRRRAERQRRYDEEHPSNAPQPGTGAPYGFGPYSQEPPPIPGPPPQGEYAPPPQEPFHYPQEGFAPPNAYSPMPQFVGAGPGPNGYDNHAYGGAPQGAGAGAGAGGYGYQQPQGPYPPHNVSPPLELPEQIRAVDVGETIASRRPSQAEESDTEQDHSKSKRSSKSVMFDLRPKDENPHHSPNSSPRTLLVDRQIDAHEGYGRERDGMSDEPRENSHDATYVPHQPRGPYTNRYDGDDDRASRPQERRHIDGSHDGEGSRKQPPQRRAGDHDKREQGQRHGRATGRRKGEESDDSSETISLPDRFDSQGRRIPERGEDPLSDRVEDAMHGRGAAGRMFARFAQELISPFSERRKATRG